MRKGAHLWGRCVSGPVRWDPLEIRDQRYGPILRDAMPLMGERLVDVTLRSFKII